MPSGRRSASPTERARTEPRRRLRAVRRERRASTRRRRGDPRARARPARPRLARRRAAAERARLRPGWRLRLLRLRLLTRRETHDRRDVARGRRRRGNARPGRDPSRAHPRRARHGNRSGSPRGCRARARPSTCGGRGMRCRAHTRAPRRAPSRRTTSIGRNLHMHPVTLVAGEFDEEIRPWEGSLQSRYSDEHARPRRRLRRAVRDAARAPWTLRCGAALGRRARSLDLVRRYVRTVPVFPLTRDRDGGRSRPTVQGEPVVRYRLRRVRTRAPAGGVRRARRASWKRRERDGSSPRTPGP